MTSWAPGTSLRAGHEDADAHAAGDSAKELPANRAVGDEVGVGQVDRRARAGDAHQVLAVDAPAATALAGEHVDRTRAVARERCGRRAGFGWRVTRRQVR